ncbi:MAG: NAD(+) diphosphatase [Acutalibacteraceae bacterium]
MNYCYECGTRLIEKELENEGIIPYCTKCGQYRFPIYSSAVSMIVQNPSRDKILLIKQYGKPNYVLVAGYINKGESAENAVIREVREEIGLDVTEVKFNKSEYFEPTNTLMLNFLCIADSESLAALNTDEVDYAQWFSLDDAKSNIKPNSLAQRFLFSVEL